MSSRIFQSVIVQMKEATDRMIGVIDADSNVISCSDTSLIGLQAAGQLERVFRLCRLRRGRRRNRKKPVRHGLRGAQRREDLL